MNIISKTKKILILPLLAEITNYRIFTSYIHYNIYTQEDMNKAQYYINYLIKNVSPTDIMHVYMDEQNLAPYDVPPLLDIIHEILNLDPVESSNSAFAQLFDYINERIHSIIGMSGEDDDCFIDWIEFDSTMPVILEVNFTYHKSAN